MNESKPSTDARTMAAAERVGRVGCWLVGFLSQINFFAIYFELISKIHCAGGRLCHPPALWFRGGGRAPANKDSNLCWNKTAGGCCARQHKCVLAASTNCFWPCEIYTYVSWLCSLAGRDDMMESTLHIRLVSNSTSKPKCQ
jgi:hypothetical protein